MTRAAEYRVVTSPTGDLTPEERMARMTLLVGAVGSNGIVLAADKTFLELPGNEEVNDEEIDERLDGRKIVPLCDHGVVYAFAGDPISQAVGTELKRRMDILSFDFSQAGAALKETADAGFNSVPYGELVGYNINARRQLLVIFYGNQLAEHQLWIVNIRHSNKSGAERVDGLVICGARGNAARFFRHYFRFGLPVESLWFLTAQIVLAGYLWNNDIDGLDVVVANKSFGCKWLDESEKAIFRARFEELDRAVRNFLLDTSLAPSIK